MLIVKGFAILQLKEDQMTNRQLAFALISLGIVTLVLGIKRHKSEELVRSGQISVHISDSRYWEEYWGVLGVVIAIIAIIAGIGLLFL